MSSFSDNDKFKTLILLQPGIAIRILYHRYYKALVCIAEQRTHDRKAAEDIAQEALVEAWRNFERLAKQKDMLIGPYLAGIVRNKAITCYHRSLKSTSNIFREDFWNTASQEAEVVESEKREILWRSVSSLPPRQHQCIEMRFRLEMSIEAISTRLGISRKSVEKGIANGLRRLRNYNSLRY
ncbi:MAG: sigma-70 family RNA polymerase sigma factor [Bacteroidota bacterium]|nr:sigma-70 family RNA polymerase sigma factor [Bacteroidota bacterium]